MVADWWCSGCDGLFKGDSVNICRSVTVKVVIVLVVVVVVVVVVVLVVGMLLVVVGVVDNTRATTPTIKTATTTHTIPQPSIQIEKFFLDISVTLITAITTTTILPLPSIPY